MPTIDENLFSKIEMRVGTIINAEEFPAARQPAYILTIDFGLDLGVKKSSAQITTRYTIKELIGKQIVAVVNFPPKQIANMMSECLVLGVSESRGDVVLLQPVEQVKNGLRIT